jgi:hypothetical protein
MSEAPKLTVAASKLVDELRANRYHIRAADGKWQPYVYDREGIPVRPVSHRLFIKLVRDRVLLKANLIGRHKRFYLNREWFPIVDAPISDD